jgi:hypothetical protein
MARIPPSLLHLLDDTLADDERVLWQARPDAWTDMMMLRFLWWIGVPWLALTIVGIHKGWISDSTFFFLITGAVMLGGPVVAYIRDLQTLFVITNRRALILRNEWGRKNSTSTWFAQMDRLEVLPVRGHVGHLYFASQKAKSPDADYTGRYGFHHVKDADKVRTLLERARVEKKPISSRRG